MQRDELGLTRVVVLGLAVTVVGWCARPATGDVARAAEGRRFVQDTASGSDIVQTCAAVEGLGARIDFPPAPPTGPRGGDLLWHRPLEWPVFTTAEITVPHASVVAGTWLNPPQETELIPLDSDGTPRWVYPGNLVEVAASRNAGVVAAVDFDGTNTVTVRKWHPDSEVPDWSYTIPQAALGSYRALAVSPDGSIIAVFVTLQGSPAFSRLYWFGPDSAEPLGSFDGAAGSFARNLSITTHGEYVALMSAAMVHVIDTSDGSVRFSVSAGASNDPMAISGDGNYLAYGWTTLYVRKWNGSVYPLLFARPGGGDSLRQCVFSADESTLATAWNPTTHLQNRVELHELPSPTPLWSYEYEHGAGDYQDIVDNLSITADGSHVAAASWGDQMQTNPEVHVFEHAQPEPVFTHDTPGSMFDIDIARGTDGALYLAACGKHVHANEQGHGGDLYAFRLLLDLPGDCDADGDVDLDDFGTFAGCLSGPGGGLPPGCQCADLDGDLDVDLGDFGGFQAIFTGP